jgi:hypothetical protein
MSSLVDSLHQHTGLYDGDCGSGGHCDTVDAQSPGTDTSDRTFCATRRSSCCRRCRRVCGSVMTLAEGLRPCGGASRRGCDLAAVPRGWGHDLAAVPRGGGHDLAARLRPRGEAATSRRGLAAVPRGGETTLRRESQLPPRRRNAAASRRIPRHWHRRIPNEPTLGLFPVTRMVCSPPRPRRNGERPLGGGRPRRVARGGEAPRRGHNLAGHLARAARRGKYRRGYLAAGK